MGLEAYQECGGDFGAVRGMALAEVEEKVCHDYRDSFGFSVSRLAGWGTGS